MNERLHTGTFLWGVVLSLTGAALAAVGFGWWDISAMDLRYVAPVFVILVGIVVLLGALIPTRIEDRPTTRPNRQSSNQEARALEARASSQRHQLEVRCMTNETKPDRGRILVSAGSKHGSTAEIADRIAAVLTDRGHEVDIAAPDQVSDLSRYGAVVLGSAVYAGHWVASARELADRIADSSPNPETWIFSSGPVGDPPKPEEDPVDVTPIMEATSARDHRVFSGKIDKSKLSFGEKAILVAVRAQVGDFRDWNEIEAWANEIADHLVREMSDR